MKFFIMILLASCSLQGCAKSNNAIDEKIMQFAVEEALDVLGASNTLYLEPKDHFMPLSNELVLKKQTDDFLPLQSYMNYIIKADEKERILYLNETLEIAEHCTHLINFYDAFPQWSTLDVQIKPELGGIKESNAFLSIGRGKYKSICVGAHSNFVLFNRSPMEIRLISDFYRKHYKDEINLALKPKTVKLEWLSKYHAESINDLSNNELYEIVTYVSKRNLNETIFPYLEEIHQGLTKNCIKSSSHDISAVQDCKTDYLNWKFTQITQ